MLNNFTERDLDNLRYNCGDLINSALDDPEVIEIMLNPDGKLWIERYGQDQELIGSVPREQAVLILSLVASALNIIVSYQNPIVEGEFPLDGSRFEGAYPPIVAPGPSFSLRKKASKVFTLDDYVTSKTITPICKDIIEQAVINRKNIVVVGGTSSGKTTFVNAIIDAIARLTPKHRLLILEDTAELQSKSENVVFFRTSTIPGHEISMSDLSKVCMRYAPTRILVGEVRDAAALAFLKLWNTGHPGGIGTYHADSADEALDRLQELIEEAGFGAKQSLIGRAVDLIVYMEKTKSNKRQLSRIIQVNGYDKKSDFYKLETVYEI